MATNKQSSARLPDKTQAPTGEKIKNAPKEVPKSEDPVVAEPPKSREQLVREAAYRRFESRGWAHGSHEDDWIEAEKEVPPEGT
jgi:hypothetical protein